MRLWAFFGKCLKIQRPAKIEVHAKSQLMVDMFIEKLFVRQQWPESQDALEVGHAKLMNICLFVCRSNKRYKNGHGRPEYTVEADKYE